MPVTMDVTDKREITVPLPSSITDTIDLGETLKDSAREGYRITMAHILYSGNQRDQVASSLKLTLLR